MDDLIKRFHEDGYVILPEALTAAEVAQVRSELAPHFQHFGRNPFEGERTQRAYALLAKAPSMAVSVPARVELGVPTRGLYATMRTPQADITAVCQDRTTCRPRSQRDAQRP